ncbi:MAG: hypothetical protein D6720_10590 [Gammaproteobacteria bacterium]|nr:MAG: hypothetical protein D6720_10590 [Gammaproteobacteria bacterium]
MAAVDQLLLERGEYRPIEYLMLDGRLMYPDYEEWRSGGAEALDELLFGDRDEILGILRQAAEYARTLGLVAETVRYTAWGGEDPLPLSRDERLAAVLEEGYVKPPERPQMDLFMDTAGSSLANGVALALGRRDLPEAERCLEALHQADPGNPRLGGLERLVSVAQQAQAVPDDPEAALQRLEGEWLPLADELLGADSRDFLMPLWRVIHQALQEAPFDPARPRCHASYTAMRMRDWAAVVDAVEAVSDWPGQPVLVRRHLRAAEQLRQTESVMADLFRLCWHFPHEAAAVLDQGVLDLPRPWERFNDLEPELPVPQFPAWLLIVRPRMAAWLPEPDDRQPEEYRLLHALQRSLSRDRPGDAKTVQRRARLKELEPDLFHHYVRNL